MPPKDPLDRAPSLGPPAASPSNADVAPILAADSPDSFARPFRFASILLSAAVIVTAFLVAFYPMVSKLSWLLYEEDDYFYYLKIATNMAHGLGSTFNGLVPTNGYHPLWFACLAAASMISTSPRWLNAFLCIAVFLATVATYVLARSVLLKHHTNPLLASALAVYVTLYSMHLFVGGMEIILTIPLVLAVLLTYLSPALWQPRFAPSFGFGLLLSAVFLSRLDSAIILILLLLATALHPHLRRLVTAPQVAGVLAGLIPAALYVLSNRIFFHTTLTVSGMAKQLRHGIAPTSPAWHSLFSKTPAQLMNVLPILVAILVLPFVLRRLSAPQQAIYPILLFFPFLYLLILSCLSDWKLWDWYFYSLRIALLIAFALFLVWKPTGRLLNLPAVTALVALVCLGLTVMSRRKTGGFDMYDAAIEVREFSRTHPGVYAMGDRAGIVGYLLPDPMVQTEGLVMDKNFLSLLRAQTPLDQALARYHVRYYVASNYAPYSGCYQALEPYEAGPDSPHMTTELCQAPIATFNQKDYQTLIFDLSPAHATTSQER